MPLDRITDRPVDAQVAAAPRATESDARELVGAAYQVLINLGLRDARYYLPDAAWSAASLGPDTKRMDTERDGIDLGPAAGTR